jgi:hypothetical protein
MKPITKNLITEGKEYFDQIKHTSTIRVIYKGSIQDDANKHNNQICQDNGD